MYKDKCTMRHTINLKIINICKSFANDENASTAIEYALIAGLVSTAIIGSTNLLGESISDTFEKSAVHISGSTDAGQRPPTNSAPVNAPPSNFVPFNAPPSNSGTN